MLRYFPCLVIITLLLSCNDAGKKSNLQQTVSNPILPGYFADPTIIKENDIFYIYATIDPWGGDSLGVFETKDFLHFTRRHINWPTKQACSSPGSNKSMVWAPSVVRGEDGRYHMFVSVGSEVWTGVADHPLGPWKNSRSDGSPLVRFSDFKEISIHNIDADAFVDDDGTAYLFWGSGFNWINGHCLAVKLTKDMDAFDGKPTEVTPAHYFEAPHMFKRNGQYYLMFSEGKAIDSTYKIGYAVAQKPLGPFTEGKYSPVLKTIPGTPIFGPGHNTVFNENGQDYILYHRIFPQQKDYVLRQLCVDSLKFDKDGEIQPITPKGISAFTN
jgi:beta-xylosidase